MARRKAGGDMSFLPVHHSAGDRSSGINIVLQLGTEGARSRLEAAGTEMKPKGEVDYRPADDWKQCGGCIHFESNRCELVAGIIRPTFVCDLFQNEAPELEEK